jgi:hypothetical protein
MYFRLLERPCARGRRSRWGMLDSTINAKDTAELANIISDVANLAKNTYFAPEPAATERILSRSGRTHKEAANE